MAAHTEPHESATTGALLPLFAIATLIGIFAIGWLIAAPSVAAAVISLAVVIGFGAGLAVVVGRLIGPEEH